MRKLFKRKTNSFESNNDRRFGVFAYAAETETETRIGVENFDALFDGSDTLAAAYRAELAEKELLNQKHEEARYELDKDILWGVAGGAIGGPEAAAAGGLINGLRSISENCSGSGCHF
jgi:hypothetical protein